MDAFINYAFYGNVIGKSVRTIENAYEVYCKLVDDEPADEIVNRICNKYDLFVEKGVITDGI